MRKQALGILIAATLVFSGCSGKGAGLGAKDNGGQGTKSQSQLSEQQNSEMNFKPVEPGTIPQLSSEQKAQVDSKLNPAVNKLNDALKSIQDPSDIDLSSVN